MNKRTIILYKSLIFTVFLLTTFSSFTQDKVNLMNGKTLEGKVIKIDQDFIKFEEKRRVKTKETEIDRYRVFSIDYANGKEKVIYEPDSMRGNYFSVEEMRNFVYGEQDASQNFKAPMATIFGLLYGGAGGFFLAESIFIFTIPISYTILAVIFKGSIDISTVRSTYYLGEPAYVLGYERVSKAKRIQNALKGAVVGTLMGAGLYYFLKSQGEIE